MSERSAQRVCVEARGAWSDEAGHEDFESVAVREQAGDRDRGLLGSVKLQGIDRHDAREFRLRRIPGRGTRRCSGGRGGGDLRKKRMPSALTQGARPGKRLSLSSSRAGARRGVEFMSDRECLRLSARSGRQYEPGNRRAVVVR